MKFFVRTDNFGVDKESAIEQLISEYRHDYRQIADQVKKCSGERIIEYYLLNPSEVFVEDLQRLHKIQVIPCEGPNAD